MRILVAALAAASLLGCHQARAQNDWQYPDPYFGILEIEKSRDRSAASRGGLQPRPDGPAAESVPAPRLLGTRGRFRRSQATAGARSRPGATVRAR